MSDFSGRQLHSARYVSPDEFTGLRVMVVGGGNSAAQILAEVSLTAAKSVWVTLEKPAFLPDDVDGRVLFERATARWRALQEGRSMDVLPGGFGDIVMVPPVREARARGVLNSVGPFAKMMQNGVIWTDGTPAEFDAVIWCTGFRPALDHLAPLGIAGGAGPIVEGTRALGVTGLWLVGYGEWTGVASATLIGVMRSARQTAIEIDKFLEA